MNKPLLHLTLPVLFACPLLADLPAGLPLSTDLLPEAAAKRRSEQSVDSENVNGTFSVTLTLNAGAFREALEGGRLQVLDTHLKAGRKSATNVGYAVENGVVHFTHMRFHRAQSDPIPATGTDTLEEFSKDKANVESIRGAVITFVHASGHNTGDCPSGSYYYLDLETTRGHKSFTGYAENLRVSDRRLGSVAIPQGSPALSGTLYPETALTAPQAAESNAKAGK